MLRYTGLTLKSFGVRAARIVTIGRISWMSMLSAVGMGQQRRQGCLWVGLRGNGMVWCGGGGLVEVVGEGGKLKGVKGEVKGKRKG